MGRGIPPAYVSAILQNRVLIAGNVSRVYPMLMQDGFRERVRRETPTSVAIHFSPTGGETNSDPAMHAVLRWLTDHGVAFAESREHAESVADVARMLQQRRRLPRHIVTFEWTSQDTWRVQDVIGPAAGKPMAPVVTG